MVSVMLLLFIPVAKFSPRLSASISVGRKVVLEMLVMRSCRPMCFHLLLLHSAVSFCCRFLRCVLLVCLMWRFVELSVASVMRLFCSSVCLMCLAESRRMSVCCLCSSALAIR